MQEQKTKIYFIVNYIGPLRYYEKLIPYLKDRYEVGFLFIRMHKEFTQTMIDYCKIKGYTYFIIDDRIIKSRFPIPFWYPIKSKYVYIKRCRDFLNLHHPTKLITMQNTKFQIHESCTKLIKDCKYVEVDDNGDIKKDRSSDTKYSDYLDCLRYYAFTFHHKFVRLY